MPNTTWTVSKQSTGGSNSGTPSSPKAYPFPTLPYFHPSSLHYSPPLPPLTPSLQIPPKPIKIPPDHYSQRAPRHKDPRQPTRERLVLRERRASGRGTRRREAEAVKAAEQAVHGRAGPGEEVGGGFLGDGGSGAVISRGWAWTEGSWVGGGVPESDVGWEGGRTRRVAVKSTPPMEPAMGSSLAYGGVAGVVMDLM